MAYHARLGPSSAFRWRKCTASPSASDGISDKGNDASRAGTAEHEAAAECLQHDRDPHEYLGREFVFLSAREELWLSDLPFSRQNEILHRVVLDEEAIDRIEVYVNFVREIVRTSGGVLLVENRVPVEHITGEHYFVDADSHEVEPGTPGAIRRPAGGTSDAIVLVGDEMIVIDYKSGQMRVSAYDEVKPEGIDIISGEPTPAVLEPNDQAAMYASGALVEYGWMGDFKRIRLIIVQPRLNSISEYAITRDELEAHIETLRQAATETRTNPTYRPDNETCGFCRARVNCKARDEYVLNAVLDGFTPGDPTSIHHAPLKPVNGNLLGVIYAKLEMIQTWCGDIHRRVYQELLAQRPVINPDGVAYKLVEGRAGNRAWTDTQKVEALLTEQLGSDLAYNRKVISPADAEKLAKAKKARKGNPALPALIDAERWTALQGLMKQEPGKPVISLASDPKPAIDPATSGFTDQSVNLFE